MTFKSSFFFLILLIACSTKCVNHIWTDWASCGLAQMKAIMRRDMVLTLAALAWVWHGDVGAWDDLLGGKTEVSADALDRTWTADCEAHVVVSLLYGEVVGQSRLYRARYGTALRGEEGVGKEGGWVGGERAVCQSSRRYQNRERRSSSGAVRNGHVRARQ